MTIIVLALTLLLGAPAAAQTPAAPLRHKFTAGEKRLYVRTQKRVMKTMVDGRDVTQTLTRTTDLTLVIEKVGAENAANARLVVTRVRYARTGPGENTTYDSADRASAATAPASLGALVNASFALTLSPRGEVANVCALPATVAKLKNTGANGLLPTLVGGVKYLVPTIALPPKTLAAGDTWTEPLRFEVPALGTITGTYTYTFRGPSAPLEVTTTDTVSFAPEPGALLAARVDKYADAGTITWDNDAGRLVRRAVTTTMTMTITLNEKTLTQNSESTDTVQLTAVR